MRAGIRDLEMAAEIRIIRGDSYDIICTVKDQYGIPVTITGNWDIEFQSDYVNKNSVDNPGDFVIETSPYTTGQFLLRLQSDETNPPTCKRSHFKIRLYQGTIIKTVSSGDLFFIDEAV